MKRTQPVSVNFPPTMYDEIEIVRKQENRGRSNMIVQLCKEALEARAVKDACQEAVEFAVSRIGRPDPPCG